MSKLTNEVFDDAARSENISLEMYNVSGPDLLKLFNESLSANNNLKSLNLSNSTLGGLGISLVSQLLKKKSSIQIITLNNCQLMSHDLDDFLREITKSKSSLQEISLEGNPFDERAIMALENFKRKNPNINLRYSLQPVPRNPADIYPSLFEDSAAIKKPRQN